MEAPIQLVHYYLDKDLNENALFITERLWASNPEEITWSHLRALSCLRLGRHALAADFSRQAGSNGQHLGCAYVFAQACLHLKRYPEGIKALKQARAFLDAGQKQADQQTEPGKPTPQPGPERFCPDSSAINNLLGKLSNANGDHDFAAVCFTSALKENPFMWDAFLTLCDNGVKLSVLNIFKLREENPNKGKIVRPARADHISPGLVNPTGRRSNRPRKPLVSTPPRTSQQQPTTDRSIIHDSSASKNTSNEDSKSFQTQNAGMSKKRHRPGLGNASTTKVSEAPALRSTSGSGNGRGVSASSTGLTSMNAQPRRSARLMKKTPADQSSSIFSMSKENVKPVAKLKNSDRRKEMADPPSIPKDQIEGSLSLTAQPFVSQLGAASPVSPESEKLVSLIGLLQKIGSGYYHLSRFELRQCLEDFLSLPVEQQSTPWVLSKTARAHYELMAYKESKAIFQAVRKLAPAWLEDLEVFSTVLWYLKHDVELASLAHELSESHYLSPQSWCTVGNSFSLNKSHRDAIEALSRACQLNPPCAHSFSLLGYEHVEVEDYIEAAKAFRRALQVNTRHYPAWVGLGRVQEKLGENEKALQYYKQAETINPSNSVLMTYMARVLGRTGQHGLALGYLRRGLKLDPPESILCLIKMQMASIYLRLNQPWEALKHLRWVEKFVPDESRIHLMLGRAYSMLGPEKKGVALKCYTTALSLAPFSEDIKLAILDLEDDS
ncbi:hypothetical protein BGZ63DRAFT_421714 [Mariannaea sp. PMI_226]|nr:hypothetical protein BGZ63DRAFT_421714 [Mariannaea sp. PMI_226]